MKVVKLKYYDEFHCIGPECTNHCCKDWSILFGKREYLDYKKANCSKELTDVINTAFVRLRDHEKLGVEYNEKSNYAQIRLNENGECPFRGLDGLCMIQKELGEKALSYTCSVFPRLYGLVGGEVLIFGCSITCPHVVELMIAHSEGLEIFEHEYNGRNDWVNKGLYSIPVTDKNWEGYSQYWTIKNAQIDVLQNRKLTISERLLILGFFSKKTDEYINAGQLKKIENLYNMMLDNELCESIANSLKTSQSDESAAIKSVNDFVKMYQTVKQFNKIDDLFKMFEQVAESIDVKIEKLADENKFRIFYDLEKYFKNLGVFRAIETERSYIFENILVNMAFLTPPHEGLFKSFFKLAIFYNILKISLPAFLKEDWNDTDLATAITYSAKMVVNTKMAERVSERDFTEHGSFDLPHIAFMIS